MLQPGADQSRAIRCPGERPDGAGGNANSPCGPRRSRRWGDRRRGRQRSATPRSGTKLAEVIALLRRDAGSSVTELMAATGWLPHTTRAALTGLRKRGYAVTREAGDDRVGVSHRRALSPRPSRLEPTGARSPQCGSLRIGRADRRPTRTPWAGDRASGGARSRAAAGAVPQPHGPHRTGPHLARLLLRVLAYRLQAERHRRPAVRHAPAARPPRASGAARSDAGARPRAAHVSAWAGQARHGAGARMARPHGARHGARRGLCLERHQLRQPVRRGLRDDRHQVERTPLLRPGPQAGERPAAASTARAQDRRQRSRPGARPRSCRASQPVSAAAAGAAP